MAVSKARASTIATFARYNDALAGNTPAGGAFCLQAGSSATRYVSSDGLSWTAFALTNPVRTLNWVIWSPINRLWVLGSSTPNTVVFARAANFTAKVRTVDNGSWAIGNTFNGAGQFTDTGVDILWGNGGGWVTDMYGLRKWSHPTTSFTVSPPAYDGGTTWAVVPVGSSTSSGRYSTNDSSSGDGIMPFATGAVGQNGWGDWPQFSYPTTLNLDHIKFYSGFWYIMTNGGVVYNTANIATSSPSWNNQGTLLRSPFFIVNNEIWLIPFWSSGTTAYRATTGNGTWTAITLPSNKQCTGIAFGNGVYVMACSDGTVHRSTTGASGSWSNVSTGATSTTTFNAQTIDFGAN